MNTGASRTPARTYGPIGARPRARFLEALAAGSSVEEAATAGGRSKQMFYRLRAADEAFEAEWRAAVWQRAEKIEERMERAAIDGWDEETFDGDGNLVRREHKWSQRPGEVLLRAARSDQYREGANVNVAVAPVIVFESAFERPPVTNGTVEHRPALPRELTERTSS